MGLCNIPGKTEEKLTTLAPAPPQSYRASHFAPAFFFLPSEKRRAMKLLYAVCRVLDDAVDQGLPNAGDFLNAWKTCFVTRQTQALEPFGQSDLAREFIDVVLRYNLPQFALVDLIEKGVALDLTSQRFQTPLDTENYCYGVAGTVGILCLPIFGVPWSEAKDFAVRLGITVQWINMIRDVGVDAKIGRIYLPLDHLEQFGYTERELFALENTDGFQALIRNEALVARAHHKRALELMPERWRRELFPARMMGQIYIKLLDKIERQSFPVLTRKVALNAAEKIKAAWATFYG